MDPLWLIAILVAVFGAAFLLLFLRRSKNEANASQRLQSLATELTEIRREQLLSRGQAEELRKSIGESLSTSKVEMAQKLDSTQKVVAAVNEQLGALGKSTERIQEFGKEIRSLQDVLQSPKLRGNFGEFLLQELLQAMLPPDHYQMQYGFRDGTAVDAVVRLSGKLIPIDSKFPLDSFQRMVAASEEKAREVARREFLQSVRVRVDQIESRYIRPEDGTYDFALMYLPSEAVYYEIVVKEQDFGDKRSPLQYALAKKVIPVSPSSFYAYLATIAFGLRGMQVEKEAEEIRNRVGMLQRDFIRFLEVLQGIDKNLEFAKKKFEDALGKGGRIADRMTKIAGTGTEQSIEVASPAPPPIIDLPKNS